MFGGVANYINKPVNSCNQNRLLVPLAPFIPVLDTF